jgi:hypothetical protein
MNPQGGRGIMKRIKPEGRVGRGGKIRTFWDFSPQATMTLPPLTHPSDFPVCRFRSSTSSSFWNFPKKEVHYTYTVVHFELPIAHSIPSFFCGKKSYLK